MTENSDAVPRLVEIQPDLPPAADTAEPSFLGETLRSSGRHPVLVFGTTQSGKSTILMSLIREMRSCPDIHLSLGDPILPPSNAKRKEAHTAAEDFFYRRAEDFIHNKKMLAATEAAWPFFIPIDMRPSTEPAVATVKLAFLEGKGEWYDPDVTGVGRPYQAFKADVLDVLKYYNKPITVIYVSPISSSRDGKRRTDVGLTGALDEYTRARKAYVEDAHLFLLTMWDQRASPLANDPEFGAVQGEQVKEILRRDYPDAWNAFQALPHSVDEDRRFYMQYCAGHIEENVNRDPPSEQRAVFDRYPRTLLNWIYGNATREKAQADENSTVERVLFPDVMRPSGFHLRLTERFANLLISRPKLRA